MRHGTPLEGMEARLAEFYQANAEQMSSGTSLWDRIEPRLTATPGDKGQGRLGDMFGRSTTTVQQESPRARGGAGPSTARRPPARILNAAALAAFAVVVVTVAIGLSAILSRRADVPSPASQLIDRFVRTTDRDFGYEMLVPDGWESINIGGARGYMPRGSEGQADRVTLEVTNYEALSDTGGGAQVVQLELWKRNPQLTPWTRAIEEAWRVNGIRFEKLRTLPNAVIYSLAQGQGQATLTAFAVDANQPLTASLSGYGAYGSKEKLAEAGLVKDFETMVGSLKAFAPRPQGDRSSYSGESVRTVTATTGPLQLQVWRTAYDARGTNVDLRLKNGGESPALLAGMLAGPVAIGPGEEPPAPPPYYLLDDKGRKYAALGSGWTSQAGDKPESAGKALPGKTAEFALSFESIPTDATGLTLVMDGVKTEDGRTYDLRIGVPLPEPAR